MRPIVFCILLAVQPAFAVEYLLTLEQECGYAKKAFQCKNSSETSTIAQRPDGTWVGVNPSGRAVELRVMKNDEFILVLENPVLFSGTSTIHLMKKTGRFYWSEFAYSDMLKADEATVIVGRVKRLRQEP